MNNPTADGVALEVEGVALLVDSSDGSGGLDGWIIAYYAWRIRRN